MSREDALPPAGSVYVDRRGNLILVPEDHTGDMGWAIGIPDNCLCELCRTIPYEDAACVLPREDRA